MKNLRLAIIPMLLAGCGGGGGPSDTSVATGQQNVPANPSQNTPANPLKPPVAPPADEGNTLPPTPAPSNPLPPANPAQPPVIIPPVEPPPPVAIPTEPPQPEPPPVPTQPHRYLFNNPDGEDATTVQIIYLTPVANVGDRGLDTNGTLNLAARSINSWLAEKANGLQLQFDMYEGAADVTHVMLQNPDTYYDQFGATKRDAIEQELVSRNILYGNKRYLIYYEGNHATSCGDARTAEGMSGIAAFVYLRAGNGACWQNGFAGERFGFLEAVSLHEIMHSFGAPHTNDPNDIMYGGALDSRPNRTVNMFYLNNDYVTR